MDNIMCFVIVAALAVGVTAAMEGDQAKKHIEEMARACAIAENANAADVNLTLADGLPISKEGQCFVGCMLEKLGFMANGSFDRQRTDAIVKNAPPIASKPDLLEKMLKGHEACETEVGKSTDKCVTGPKLHVCLTKLYNTTSL